MAVLADEVRVSPVVFGAMSRGDPGRLRSVLEAARAEGIAAIDTAPLYDLGGSERALGELLADMGWDVPILTKVGLRWDDPRGPVLFEAKGPDGRPLPVRRNARPDSVRHEVEASLGRLRRERLDLVQVHQPDPETPVEDTMGALLDLRREGKIGAIGVSNFSVELMARARKALGDVPLASLQSRYNLLEREVERGPLPWARDHGVGFLAYSPLAEGRLTGKAGPERVFTDYRAHVPHFSVENRRRVQAAIDAALAPIARAHDVAPATVALAWLLHRPGVTAVLAGASRPEQVAENARAARLTLSPDEQARLGAAFEQVRLDGVGPGLLGRVKGKLRRALGR